ncbi:BMP family ABC transporter substrate-binding protein [Paraclostridium ghonii]|uniref:Basic membrane protein A n=1 Tax=Paraclostridium ghonii TaxID=29358 RepID=A0ABU0MXL7_9FIRM|nr:BMP family ABC transporter substrate-binding protein [Paeniclostridium ghonii]MDQ0555368.1 basic membrane protein A [Paeniclostridium ghonii]
MRLNYKKLAILTGLILIMIIAYNQEGEETKLEVKHDEGTKIAIIFNEAGLGDKAFNDLCYDGVLRAQEDLGIEFDYAQSKSKNDYEKFAREYAKVKDYDLIISVGGEQESAVKKVSKQFPEQKFTIIDSKLELPNVSSINTKWEQQTFLNGVIAGLELSTNKNKSVGIILGKDFEHLNEGAIGFEAGVKYVNPDATVMKSIVGDFSDPAKAREIALSMYNKGAIYIQQLSGQSGLGVFLAAKQVNKYAFGVDGNQNSFAPDNIVATAIRYANDIIYQEIKNINNNSWNSGVHKIGLRENVIDCVREGSNVKLKRSTIENVEKIKKDIINENIVIPKTYEELNAWIKVNNYKINR